MDSEEWAFILASGQCVPFLSPLPILTERSRGSLAPQTSSAKMGASADTSVVDPELRVHGVRGLRVMDASVFPTMVSGHPCAVIIAMAERAADLMKASAKDQEVAC